MNSRRELFPLAALLALPADGAAKWPDAVFDASKLKVVPDPAGEHRQYFEGPTDQLSLMVAGSFRLKPGMSPHPPHDHGEEEFMLVTEGTGEIEIAGKRSKVQPGSMMYCAASKPHAIYNTGSSPLLFYYFKWKR